MMDIQKHGKNGVLITLENEEEIETIKGIMEVMLMNDNTWMHYKMAEIMLDLLNELD